MKHKSIKFLTAAFVLLGATALAKHYIDINSEENIIKLLQERGFSDIKKTGYGWTCLNPSDELIIAATFDAKKDGTEVSGEFCANRISLPDSVSFKTQK